MLPAPVAHRKNRKDREAEGASRSGRGREDPRGAAVAECSHHKPGASGEESGLDQWVSMRSIR